MDKISKFHIYIGDIYLKYADKKGIQAWCITLILGTYWFCFLVFVLFFGWLMNKFKYKP